MGGVACLYSLLQRKTQEKIEHEEIPCWGSRKTAGHARPFRRGRCIQPRSGRRKRLSVDRACDRDWSQCCKDISVRVPVYSCLGSTHIFLSYNSPEAVVYNQCANEMLRYTIKSQEGHQVDVPKQKFDDKTAVPPPPRPGEVEVITAGFPWSVAFYLFI